MAPYSRTACSTRNSFKNGRKNRPNDYGTGIPLHEAEALARILFLEIQAFFESEEWQREFAEWKIKQLVGKDEQE